MRYANVVSTLALFLSLSGGAYAVTQISDNSVSSRHVVNGSLTGTDVKTGTVTGSDIKDASLDARDIVGGLPGITYFKFNDKKFPFNSSASQPIITDTILRAGVYFVEAQVSGAGAHGADTDVICRVHYGAGASPPAAAIGGQSTKMANQSLANAQPTMTMTISGVFEAKEDNTPVVLRCAGLGVSHHNSRMAVIELRDLRVEIED